MSTVVKKIFSNDWRSVRLIDIGSFSKGVGISREQTSENGHNAVRYGELYTTYNYYIRDVHTHISDVVAAQSTQIQYGDILFAGSGETNDEIGKSAAYLVREDGYAGGDIIIFRPKNANSMFLAYYLNIGEARKKLRELGQGQSVVHIYKKDIQKLKFALPPLPEQNRIVAVLETWDRAIENLTRKIEIKKEIKKGLMQNLLNGKIRLTGFTEKWRTVELGEILDYEQPGRYIVTSTEYNNEHKTPVLTANKGFILGYTNEVTGIYNDLPAIIFDDFTTDTKFVDFPFKVKSSAIKILTSKNSDVNIRFVFEKIQQIKLVVGEHKRHYLSEYQYIAIDVPPSAEQKAITCIITDTDNEIKILERKLVYYRDQKKYLLNKLITGDIRTPEMIAVPECTPPAPPLGTGEEYAEAVVATT